MRPRDWWHNAAKAPWRGATAALGTGSWPAGRRRRDDDEAIAADRSETGRSHGPLPPAPRRKCQARTTSEISGPQPFHRSSHQLSSRTRLCSNASFDSSSFKNFRPRKSGDTGRPTSLYGCNRPAWIALQIAIRETPRTLAKAACDTNSAISVNPKFFASHYRKNAARRDRPSSVSAEDP
jgi:hypothetical protein